LACRSGATDSICFSTSRLAKCPLSFGCLLRHAELLKSVDEWTIRVLLPRRLRKAAALYRYAVRDAFMMPLTPRDTDELDWFFRARRGELACPGRDRDFDLSIVSRKLAAARFEALYRVWRQRGVQALWAMLTRKCRSIRAQRLESGATNCR
jgi:hypothetical protein